MRLLETLVPVGFVVIIIICFLQGRHAAQRPRRSGRLRTPSTGVPVVGMGAFREDDEPPFYGIGSDPFLTAEIPRDWLETALQGSGEDAHRHSTLWPDEGHLMGSLAVDHQEGSAASDPLLDIGLINPASGLPMLSDGPMDIAGNRFGENDSQNHWYGQDHDTWSSDSSVSSSSNSSWDDYR